MNSKLFGGVLLVVGTTIGAGMLALPVATADLGFLGSLALLIGCWAVMTLCAFVFLEVNLRLPPRSNLISMAGATLGRWAQIVVWVLYTTLLYSLISAYVAGGGDLFHYLLCSENINTSLPVASILFTVIFAVVVYFGIRTVDYVNRGLMLFKMGAYMLLLTFIAPHISLNKLSTGNLLSSSCPSSIAVAAVAFGSLMIIPSLRTYFENDIKTLRKAIFIGMTIPLLCYIAWDMIIMGIIPLDGALGLKQMVHSTSTNSDLIIALTTSLKQNGIALLAKFFSSICMTTSFLSISLSLSDFLSDGLGVPKKGLGGILVFAATFIPPVLVTIFYPNAFIRSLDYAGLCCFVLMVLLPPLMAWRGRYNQPITAPVGTATYQVMGGKATLIMLMIVATILIVIGMHT